MEVYLVNLACSKGPTGSGKAVSLLNKLPHLWFKFDKLGIRIEELCIEFSISSLKDGVYILTLCSE